MLVTERDIQINQTVFCLGKVMIILKNADMVSGFLVL